MYSGPPSSGAVTPEILSLFRRNILTLSLRLPIPKTILLAPCQDLLAVQKLLLQKTSDRAGKDALLFDAAQVVAQRRKKGRGGGEGKARGDQQRTLEGEADSGAEQTEGSRDRPLKVKKYAHTGWFHTFE